MNGTELIRKIAGLLDDRLTVTALGLAVGRFGLPTEQWGHVADAIVVVATAVLALVPDPKLKKAKAHENLPPIDLVARAERTSGADGVQQPDVLPHDPSRPSGDTRPTVGWGDQ